MKKIIELFLAVAVVVLIVFSVFVTKSRDITPPVITFDSNELVYVQNSDQNILLSGVHANDNHDGDVTASIVVENVLVSPDKSTASVFYVARDSSNNIVKASRDVVYVADTSRTAAISSKQYGMMLINNHGVQNLATEWGKMLRNAGYDIVSIGLSSNKVGATTMIYVPEEGVGIDLLDYFEGAQIVVGTIADKVNVGTNGAQIFIEIGTDNLTVPV